MPFPYEIPLIAVLQKIVRDNYQGLAPDEKPCQKKAGLELDEAMGWEVNSNRGIPSRPSASIVARLQPEKWREDPKRSRKPKNNN